MKRWQVWSWAMVHRVHEVETPDGCIPQEAIVAVVDGGGVVVEHLSEIFVREMMVAIEKD